MHPRFLLQPLTGPSQRGGWAPYLPVTPSYNPLQMYETMQAVTAQRNEQCDRKQMGAWIADYLDDAGYEIWEAVPYTCSRR